MHHNLEAKLHWGARHHLEKGVWNDFRKLASAFENRIYTKWLVDFCFRWKQDNIGYRSARECDILCALGFGQIPNNICTSRRKCRGQPIRIRNRHANIHLEEPDISRKDIHWLDWKQWQYATTFSIHSNWLNRKQVV